MYKNNLYSKTYILEKTVHLMKDYEDILFF